MTPSHQNPKNTRWFPWANDESRICFAAAIGCAVVGLVAFLVNMLWPATTQLHALFFVGVFYMVLAAVEFAKSWRAAGKQSIASTLERAVDAGVNTSRRTSARLTARSELT